MSEGYNYGLVRGNIAIDEQYPNLARCIEVIHQLTGVYDTMLDINSRTEGTYSDHDLDYINGVLDAWGSCRDALEEK